DVLDLLLASVLERKTQLVANLIADHAADADPAGRRQRLQAGSDIDAVAVDVPPILDDVAEIDPDAELDPPIRRYTGVAQRHLALHFDGAANRVDDAGELDQQPVTHGSDDAAAVFLDLRIDERAPQLLQPFERSLLVLPDKPRVTRDIRRQDGRQPPLHLPFTHFSPAKQRNPLEFSRILASVKQPASIEGRGRDIVSESEPDRPAARPETERRVVQRRGRQGVRRPPIRTGSILLASPVLSSVSSRMPHRVASPSATCGRSPGIFVTKRSTAG